MCSSLGRKRVTSGPDGPPTLPNKVLFVFGADDGKIFQGSGVGDAFGPRCFKGDVMGCGIMFPRDYVPDGGGEGFARSAPLLVRSSGRSHLSAWSSGESEDWDGSRGRLGGRKNVPYLPEEEEEEEEVAEVEQGREKGKVTVRKLPKVTSPAAFQPVKLVSVRWRNVQADHFQTGLVVVRVGTAGSSQTGPFWAERPVIQLRPDS